LSLPPSKSAGGVYSPWPPAKPPIREHVVAQSFLIGGLAGGHGEYTPPADFDGGRDNANLSIRTPTHRYILRWDDRDELYDLATDPYENRNIAAQPDSAPVIARLRRALAEEMHDAPPAILERLRHV
jgi:hypothetical protein